MSDILPDDQKFQSAHYVSMPIDSILSFHSDVSAILQQALDQSPAYGSIRNVLDSLNSEEVCRRMRDADVDPLVVEIAR